MLLARTLLQPPRSSLVARDGRRTMAALPALPLLIKGAALIKKIKIGTSWGSILTSRATGEKATYYRLWMRRLALGSAGTTIVGSAYVYTTSQEEIAISGRKRLLLTTREEEIQYANEASAQVFAQFKDKMLMVHDLDGTPPEKPKPTGLFGRRVSPEATRNYSLLMVAERLIGAVNASIDLPSGVQKLRWRLHLVDEDMLNAFVLPNGHIYVFTGVLRATPSLDVLAFLLGHECAHALLRHGGEELSQAPIYEMAGLLATSALAAVLPIDSAFTFFQATLLRLGLNAVQAPAHFLHLHYSRDHETEADEVGVLLASRACFDPYHAQYLFHNFAELKKQAGQEDGDSAFSSTHPLDKDREDAMRSQLWKAMRERDACQCEPVDFKQRKRLDKELNREHLHSLRRMSCSVRNEEKMKKDKEHA